MEFNPKLQKWSKAHVGGHDLMRVVAAKSGVLIWCCTCWGSSRHRLAHQLSNRCNPQTRNVQEHGRMKKIIEVLGEGEACSAKQPNLLLEWVRSRFFAICDCRLLVVVVESGVCVHGVCAVHECVRWGTRWMQIAMTSFLRRKDRKLNRCRSLNFAGLSHARKIASTWPHVCWSAQTLEKFRCGRSTVYSSRRFLEDCCLSWPMLLSWNKLDLNCDKDSRHWSWFHADQSLSLLSRMGSPSALLQWEVSCDRMREPCCWSWVLWSPEVLRDQQQ